KPASRTAGTGPKDQPPALRRSTVPHSGKTKTQTWRPD
ncbi:HRASLS5 isoform 5, partial [Pan troglodytes]